ncbi:uncharacterized protein LOC118749473 [Rhagoletis pomonella]|uniref:uncharacterized protein LOC118749473 n=1 Tax=Rhagoletis pomonella TaxID=28610 RepID=UPI0017872C3E|nr:uncharacterized protein LOC118749473 [Rhagoletis pomonella]
MQAVQQSRDIYMHRQKSLADLASDHINRMKVAARCSRPVPRVFHVSNTTSETFVPSCTILHRCGEDTGCCRSMGQVCTVKLYEEVPLHFIVIQVNSSNSRPQIKILRLRNDTECHCINRTDFSAPELFTRDKRSGFAFRRRDQQNQVEDRTGLNDNNEDYFGAVCRCPRHFIVFQENMRWQQAQQWPDINLRLANTLNCRCDCVDINTQCQRFKSGEEGFPMDDRRCIAGRICSVPNCSFGIYNEQIGRCPRPRRKQKRHSDGFG